MDRNGLRQALLEMLEENTGEKYDHLNDETNLREGLGLDSVDLVTLVIEIQTRFHVQIDSKELESLRLVGDVLDLLQRKMGDAAASAA
jgi:acyl carrier protein